MKKNPRNLSWKSSDSFNISINIYLIFWTLIAKVIFCLNHNIHHNTELLLSSSNTLASHTQLSQIVSTPSTEFFPPPTRSTRCLCVGKKRAYIAIFGFKLKIELVRFHPQMDKRKFRIIISIWLCFLSW